MEVLLAQRADLGLGEMIQVLDIGDLEVQVMRLVVDVVELLRIVGDKLFGFPILLADVILIELGNRGRAMPGRPARAASARGLEASWANKAVAKRPKGQSDA